MKARLVWGELTWCLVIGLGVTLSATSALGDVHFRDPNYSGIRKD
jgi:hypothetical protein